MYAGSAVGPITVKDVMSAAGVLSDMTAGRWLDDDQRLAVVTEGKQGVARVWQRNGSRREEDMLYNSWDLGQQDGGAVVRVTLAGNAANFRLMDSSNYRSFPRGEQHRYFGGHYDRSPITLPVPNAGHWYVTVDYGGYAGRGRAAVQVLAA